MLRTLPLALVCLLPTTAFALDYPQPSNASERAAIERYKQDRPLLTSDSLFNVPNPVPSWPCAVPEVEQYRLAGLHMAHPQLKAEIDKAARKQLRENGMAASSMPVTTYSNVRIIPLKAQCTAGKLSGEVQLLVFATSQMVTKTTDANGTSTTIIDSDNVTLTQQRVDATPANASSRSITKSKVKISSRSDNPQVDAMMKQLGQQNIEQKPSLSTTYIGAYGSVASFSEMEIQTPGLFGGKSTPTLNTSFTTMFDEHRGQMTTYTNGQLGMSMTTKDGLPHGEQVTYMDNFLKKSNLRMDQVPGMEGAEEVNINGVELIVKRSCFQNGAPVKMSPCKVL
ncbi:hypothetical protein [Pseudomonas sp. 5P_3.1_Bac2]|uniref:hypothetical protein n=1 Tax=Pseudomonas sp. 5P_3.1_Bac2 TaxID=2971617 RepID=UPI0021C8480F|nr:hypothetical protein [Pseudomonas sp. 5P_3.1_Bac2]MCU1716365.1 hypothetical protein [Pseudomonas sp. 5P_3.1_Bac2]